LLRNSYDQFYTHALAQFRRAREYRIQRGKYGNQLQFKFQLKFGNFYFTNLSPTLLSTSDQATVSLSKLCNELTFNTYDFGGGGKKPLKNIVSSLSMFNMGQEGAYVMKKKLFQQNFTAFNSNINNDMDAMHSLLYECGFNLVVSSNYFIYISVKSHSNSNLLQKASTKTYKLKYDSELKLVSLKKLKIIDLNRTPKSS
jgi:hypothetical protein